MNNNEKLGLIERVDHASEDQAKRTLRSMILKCTVRQDTISRAIKDAIERYTPTTMIVYQQPESEDEDEAAIDSSRKKSKKKKGRDGGSQDEEGAPFTTSKKRRSTRRGDINVDPLVGQLILKKTKTKMKHEKTCSNDHDEEQHNGNSSKKNKSNEQRVSGSSIGGSSKQKAPIVIDLVSSSDDESDHTEQPGNESLDENSFNGGSPDIDSQGDHSSDSDSSDSDSSDSTDSSSSDDEGTENEQQDDGLSGGIPPSQKNPIRGVNRASERNSDGSHGVAQSITFSRAKASKQSNRKELSPVTSGKKRKAHERTVEEIQNDRPIKSTSDAPLNKKPKPNLPLVPGKHREHRKCRECGTLFPSLAQLLKHGVSCKGFNTTPGSHHRPEPSSHDHSGRLKQVQKASQPAGSSSTGELHDTLQLPSRPLQAAPADPGLSVPPPNFIHESNNFTCGLVPRPLALARSASGMQRSRPDLAQHPVQKLSPNGSPGHQLQLPRPDSITQHLIERDEVKVFHQCKFCKEWFTEDTSAVGACNFHQGAYRSLSRNSRRTLSNCSVGQYQLLTEKQLAHVIRHGRAVASQPYEAWTCCQRPEKNAPPCNTGGMHVRSGAYALHCRRPSDF